MLPLRRRLTVKVTAIGLLFLALLSASMGWHYFHMRGLFVKTGKEEALVLARSVTASIKTFVLETEQGGALIDELVPEINKVSGNLKMRMVHSESVNVQYGREEEEAAVTEHEKEALLDGAEKEYESEDRFHYVVPIIAVEECVNCHELPDGSGRPVPNGYVIGLVEASVSKAPMIERLEALKDETKQTAGILATLLATLALFTMGYITTPIGRMLKSIQRLRQGDLHERVHIDQNDEIGKLAENFNAMADQLEKSFKKLQNWNVELESEVASQTRKIREMRDYYQAVIDSTQRIIITSGPDLIIDSVNAEFDERAEKYGLKYTKDELVGISVLSFVPEAAAGHYEEACRKIIHQGDDAKDNMYREEQVFTLEDGSRKTFSLTISPLIDSDGKTVGLVFVISDITEAKRAEEMLRVERNKLNAIMDGMGDTVMIVDKDYNVTYMNRLMETTFANARLGEKCHFLVAGSGEPCPGCGMTEANGDEAVEIESKNGRYYLATHSPITDIDGSRMVIAVIKDITFRKQMEEELKELSITDNLTGLFNKRHFAARLEDEVVRARRQGQPLSLIFADIDKFKNFNDTYGHVEGDDCLAELGKIIRKSMRNHVDEGFRYGGEEFTALLPGATAEQAVQIAERIRETFKAHTFMPDLDGHQAEVNKTISIGLAQLAKDDTSENLVERADNAMYRAKRSGGDKVEIDEG